MRSRLIVSLRLFLYILLIGVEFNYVLPTIVLAAPAQGVQTTQEDNEVNVHLRAVHQPGTPPLSEIYWTVYVQPDPKQNIRKRVARGGGDTPSYNLLPGEYLVEAKSVKGIAMATDRISVPSGTVSSGTVVEFEVLFPTEGDVELKAVHVPGGAKIKDVVWDIFDGMLSEIREPQLVVAGEKDQNIFRLLPGMYFARVRALNGQGVSSREILVKGGTRQSFEVVLPEEGEIVVAAFEGGSDLPLNHVYWRVYSLPISERNSPKEVAHSGEPRPHFRLLPGRYLLKAKSTESQQEIQKELEVRAGATVEEQIVFGEK
ncbi:MAG: hypothetical protein KDD60_05275 [Bdellovibrionales bacterium]|nr:hypothetical protein [Bdellovibrionales bacterium]